MGWGSDTNGVDRRKLRGLLSPERFQDRGHEVRRNVFRDGPVALERRPPEPHRGRVVLQVGGAIRTHGQVFSKMARSAAESPPSKYRFRNSVNSRQFIRRRPSCKVRATCEGPGGRGAAAFSPRHNSFPVTPKSLPCLILRCREGAKRYGIFPAIGQCSRGRSPAVRAVERCPRPGRTRRPAGSSDARRR